MSETVDDRMDSFDDVILSRVAAMFDAVDPPRDDLATDMLMALSMATLDAELATLADESALSLRTSSARATDTVTFTSSALQLMVSATLQGETLRVDGWITGGGLTVELISGTTSYGAVSDAHGRLVWTSIPPGSIRFLMHPADEESRPVLTPVMEL